MIQVKVLGPGCARCRKLTENVKQAVEELGVDCTLEKVTDMAEITGFGIVMTPALVVDGEVKSSGRVISPEEIKQLLA
jgi:small redox-active disulfide protein 2